MSYNLLAKSINQVYNIISNKLLHFSYKILNAPSEKITFLWNFCHLFPVLFYEWNQVLMTVSNFSGFFSRNHFLEGGFTFQWGVVFQFWWGVFKKIIRLGEGAPHTTTMGNPVAANQENWAQIPQIIGLDKQKVIQSVKLYISHHLKPYSSVKWTMNNMYSFVRFTGIHFTRCYM